MKLCIGSQTNVPNQLGNKGLLKSLESLLAAKLLPFDKNPGLRPIGIGEVLKRIIDLQDCAGSQQLCVGQDGGVEAIIIQIFCLTRRLTRALLLIPNHHCGHS